MKTSFPTPPAAIQLQTILNRLYSIPQNLLPTFLNILYHSSLPYVLNFLCLGAKLYFGVISILKFVFFATYDIDEWRSYWSTDLKSYIMKKHI